MASIENIIQNFMSWPSKNKIGLAAVLLISIAGTILLLSWARRADYQVLYSNLSESDAGRIVQELTAKKIPYQLATSGTILVASDKVYDLRLQLASQGLPQGGGIGFEIFDNTSFTTTEFVQKLNYRRALEGELARTIRALSGVEQSRVHLVTPDKTLFAFQENKPVASAAVFITLGQGRQLSSKEVDGIVHLVSSSVEDLAPENITVIDNRGNLLTRPHDDTMIGLSGSHLDYQQNYEKTLMAKIIGILEPVVGAGKVKARVSAAFDFTRTERTEEIYDPERVVVRSEQKSTEKTMSGMPGPAGIPGTASNLPGGVGAQVSPSQGQSQKQNEMINYETSKTIKRIVDAPVTLDRLSVAILIDGVPASEKSAGDTAEKNIARSEEDIKYYEDIVKKTIGFEEDRGDEVSIKVMPFTEMENQATEPAKRDYLPIVYSVLKYLVPLVVALLFFIIILRPVMQSLTRIPAGGVQKLPVAEAGAIEGALKPQEISLEKKVNDWASKNPQQAMGLIKGWLEE